MKKKITFSIEKNIIDRLNDYTKDCSYSNRSIVVEKIIDEFLTRKGYISTESEAKNG